MHAKTAARSTSLRPGVAVGQFALAGLLSLAVVLAGGALVLRNHSNAQALDGARALAAQAGKSVVQPRLTIAALSGDPAALRSLDSAVRRGVLSDRVVRVKIWAADGRIVYSDQPQLRGHRFALGEEELGALRTGEVVASSSNLTAPENRYERTQGELLEVYTPLVGGDGHRYLFETYQRAGAVAGMSRNIWFDVLPVLAVALLVLFLLQLPAAWALVRRERRTRAEREALLVSAIESSETERRRIAADLHDGVIQDLAGLAFSLAAARASAGAASVSPEPAERTVRKAVADLRQTLLEIAPPVGGPGLAAALEALAAPLRRSGIDVRLAVDSDLDLSPQAEALVVRTAQEALRNVARHSGAATVAVTASSAPAGGVLEVRDDGHGFSADRLAERRRAGHLGLALLTDLTTRLGGRLDISSGAAGTTVRLEVPT
jgi:two-component system, NarL family, sensor kinase